MQEPFDEEALMELLKELELYGDVNKITLEVDDYYEED